MTNRPSDLTIATMSAPISAKAKALSLCVCLLAGASALSGCYYQGGTLKSRDMHTYVSDAWHPKTVSLYDTRTDEEIWSFDVEVGQKVVIKFNKGQGPDDFYPDLMRWEVMGKDEHLHRLARTLPAPPPHSRRVDFVLRDTVENIESGLYENRRRGE